MRRSLRLLVLLGASVLGAVAAAAPAQAQDNQDGAGSPLFVQTNDPTGNAIDAFHRNADGTVTFLRSYSTGGLGGRAAGSASDPLASQGSLQLLRDEGLLLAVNAGSGSVSVFRVQGDSLRLAQVVASGGPFPTAIAIQATWPTSSTLAGMVSSAVSESPTARCARSPARRARLDWETRPSHSSSARPPRSGSARKVIT